MWEVKLPWQFFHSFSLLLLSQRHLRKAGQVVFHLHNGVKMKCTSIDCSLPRCFLLRRRRLHKLCTCHLRSTPEQRPFDVVVTITTVLIIAIKAITDSTMTELRLSILPQCVIRHCMGFVMEAPYTLARVVLRITCVNEHTHYMLIRLCG